MMPATPSSDPPYRAPATDPDVRDGSASAGAMEVHRTSDLQVQRDDCIDFGRDDRGGFAYVYRFARYEIHTRRGLVGARRYADTWSEVAIFVEDPSSLSAVPYDDEAFALTAEYFFGLTDVKTVTAFVDSEYRTVDLAVLRRHRP
jgi:hypothetical protein